MIFLVAAIHNPGWVGAAVYGGLTLVVELVGAGLAASACLDTRAAQKGQSLHAA